MSYSAFGLVHSIEIATNFYLTNPKLSDWLLEWCIVSLFLTQITDRAWFQIMKPEKSKCLILLWIGLFHRNRPNFSSLICIGLSYSLVTRKQWFFTMVFHKSFCPEFCHNLPQQRQKQSVYEYYDWVNILNWITNNTFLVEMFLFSMYV